MKFIRTVIATLAVCAGLSCAYAGFFFANPAINSDDGVIFTVRSKDISGAQYDSLFSVNLNSEDRVGDAEILTCYPEQMELLSGGDILQIRNRYGIARLDTQKKSLSWVEQRWKRDGDFALTDTNMASRYVASPDGKWFCFIKKTGSAAGDVVLENAVSGEQRTVLKDIRFSYDFIPVTWTSDSSALLYEKNGNIYFLSPEPFLRDIETDEKNRLIGSGKINSVFSVGKYVFYIDGDCVYRIGTRELYTLGLYSDIIGTGTPVGRLNDSFNVSTDYFSVNKKEDTLVVVRDNKTVAAYSLVRANGAFLSIISYYPFVNDTASVISSHVIWGGDGSPSVWFELMPYDGGAPFSVINKIASQSSVLKIDGNILPVVSPDGNRAVVFSGRSVFVFDTSDWKRVAVLSGEKALCAVWASPDTVYIGGDSTIRSWSVDNNVAEVVLLSSVSSCRWNARTVLATTNGSEYIFNKNRYTWEKVVTPVAASGAAAVQNGRYRVYCADGVNKNFDNVLFVRTLATTPETYALFPESTSRIYDTSKKVALVFDTYDSADGLAKIISALYKRNSRATFFINGEFIKRYSAETKQIAKSGNECASMFFTPSDLATGNFNMDEAFVRRGLARTEDLFYQATGEELSLLWHAPFYSAKSDIKSYAKKAGYVYVEPTFLPREFENGVNVAERDDVVIKTVVDALIKSRGGILPINVGFLKDSSRDYLCENIDLLLDALLDAGFEIVPVSSLR